MSWISDDICWCGNSNECTDTKCYLHFSNRKTKGGLFTCANLKDTNLCPSYFSSNLDNIYFVKDMRAVRKER